MVSKEHFFSRQNTGVMTDMCEYSIGSVIESTESNMKTTFPSEMYGVTLADLNCVQCHVSFAVK